MTKEEKDLLLKDLCARVPYGVRLLVNSHKGIFCGTLVTVSTKLSNTLGEAWIKETDEALWCDYKLFKPYLFPLSSMTEEQRQELESLMEVTTIPVWGDFLSPTPEYYDWLNKNHFDYRGLIPMDLAINATGLNIY